MINSYSEATITQSDWFIFPKRNDGAKLRLFCFPYSGSGAFAFRTWPENVPSQVEVCAVQLPGRENRLRERPFTRVHPLVQTIATEIEPFLDKPFVLFGHSLGALIAFELARELWHCYGVIPEHLFASARVAPQCPNRETPVYRLPDDQFIERLRDFNGTPDTVLHNKELMEMLLPVLRADFEVNESYDHTTASASPLPCSISAFRGSQDANTPYDDVAAWGEQTSTGFTLRTLPGDHFFIQSSADLFWRAFTFDLGKVLRGLQNRTQPTVNRPNF